MPTPSLQVQEPPVFTFNPEIAKQNRHLVFHSSYPPINTIDGFGTSSPSESRWLIVDETPDHYCARLSILGFSVMEQVVSKAILNNNPNDTYWVTIEE